MIFLLAYQADWEARHDTVRGHHRWGREALSIAGLAGLAALWATITTFAEWRPPLGGDFGLAVEPYLPPTQARDL
jgi:hypothetical protein